MKILEKGERADTLYGIQTEYITEEMIEALRNGQRLYTDVQGEYAVVIKYRAKTNTHDRVDIIRCKDCTHFMPIEQKGWGQCEICLNLYYSHRLVESKDYCSSAEPKQR